MYSGLVGLFLYVLQVVHRNIYIFKHFSKNLKRINTFDRKKIK